MDILSTVVSKEVEITTTVLKDELVVTLILSEREAKILGCLIGAMSPREVEDILAGRSHDFDRWLGKLESREVVTFTGNIYDGLFDIL